MTLNIDRTRGLFSKLISFSIGVSALTALVPLAVAETGQEGYLEVLIYNHKNNEKLGPLYLYVASYSPYDAVTGLDIPPGTNKGHYNNGSGKTYLVDDYKASDDTHSQMSRHGPPPEKPEDPYLWHGFRMTGTFAADGSPLGAGLTFTLGFGCDSRSQGQICKAMLDYSFLDDSEGCINYDEPRKIKAGCDTDDPTFGEYHHVPYTTVSSYDMAMGFNQRTAQFELTFWTKGHNKDQGDITSINWYGFPMGIRSGWWDSDEDQWTIESSKSYSKGDQRIRNNLKDAMAINPANPPGSSWYLELEDDDHNKKFVRANSPQQFPNIAGNPPPSTNDWYPVPSGYKFSSAYLSHLRSLHKYKCTTPGGGWIISGPWATDLNQPNQTPIYTGNSDQPNSFHCTACFNELGELIVGDFLTLTSTHDPPTDAAQLYDIRVTIPNEKNSAGWNTIERLILGGDPGGADACLQYRPKGTTPWITGSTSGHKAYHIPKDGDLNYTPAIKAAAGRMLSYPIQFGWLDNYLEVEWHEDEGYYKKSPTGTTIQSLQVGAMQWLIPIYEYIKEGGFKAAGWYDNYGATILKAQTPDNLVAYNQPYTDSYKYGKVQVPTHKDTYNRIWITIPDLTDACKSDLNNNAQNDLEDILILFEGWGKIDCDLNEDSTTNVLDLLQMLKDWGLCTPTGGG